MTTRLLSQSSIRKCAYAILLPSHYRDDGTCRCNDPTHTEMKSWGYRWEPRVGRWWVGRVPKETPNVPPR